MSAPEPRDNNLEDDIALAKEHIKGGDNAKSPVEETQIGGMVVDEAENQEYDAEPALVKKKRERKEATTPQREPGKSVLPFARVQKIIKADKEIPIVAREATFLISLATEEFIKRLCAAGQSVASRENRATVQHRDIATVVRKADEFLFLEDIMPWTTSDPVPRRPNKLKEVLGIKSAPTMLDQFVSKDSNVSEMAALEDIVMNEDGTMFVAGGIDES